ncbi:hypothetical protein ABW21_db0204430 [Orbilia brochopaga]|nr:hypothetical protein ABW21_db0204430 [Drechslerella brochopaga]
MGFLPHTKAKPSCGGRSSQGGVSFKLLFGLWSLSSSFDARNVYHPRQTLHGACMDVRGTSCNMLFAVGHLARSSRLYHIWGWQEKAISRMKRISLTRHFRSSQNDTFPSMFPPVLTPPKRVGRDCPRLVLRRGKPKRAQDGVGRKGPSASLPRMTYVRR